MSKVSLTLGSLFDGSGGFPLGGLMCGIKPIWASEIEPFAIRVTTKRLPFIKHLGDINTIDGSKIEPVDIITFGSPCQDVSIAGKREGLDGKRSSLFYEAIRVIKEMRRKTNGKYPRYCLWENVPGEHFPQTREKILKTYSKASVKSKKMFLFLNLKNGQVREKSWEITFHSHGECLMLGISEFPKEENESTLSQILEAKVPEKYYYELVSNKVPGYP